MPSRLALVLQIVGIASSVGLLLLPVAARLRVRFRRPLDDGGLRFDDEATRALDAARADAAAQGGTVDVERLLLAVRSTEGRGAALLARLGVQPAALRGDAGRGGAATRVEDVVFTQGAARALETALHEAHAAGAAAAGVEHLLLAVLRDRRGRAALARAGASADDVRLALARPLAP